MQLTPASGEVAPVLSDADTPASRPGLRTVLGLVAVGIAIAALVYWSDIKLFLGMH